MRQIELCLNEHFHMKQLLQIAFLLTASSFLMSSCVVGKFVFYNFSDIRDHKKFPNRSVAKGSTTFLFPEAAKGKVPRSVTYKGKELPFEDYLKRSNTVAFLIIQNDSIQYEQYFRGYDKASVVPSFSMAKSFTSILIGCAIDDGLIKSVQEPITNYVPELKKNGLDNVTIEHLLQMTSGIRFKESYYNPFSGAANYYYGRHLRKKLGHMHLQQAPGRSFKYISGGSQLLGLVLERALKGKTISAYLSEKVWQPLEMEYDASWSIDQKKNGMEKTFCCVNTVARDYAKIGRLYLNDGNWNGRQIVSKNWVKTSTSVDTSKGSAWYYQYQWWLPSKSGDFLAQGHLGQYIYVNPAKKLIMVRLGKNEGNVDWWMVFTSLAGGY